jgi:TIR domain
MTNHYDERSPGAASARAPESDAEKVFISWSGDSSQRVAAALYGWLPSVFGDIKPWMSSEDIQVGTEWLGKLLDELGGASIGIVCLTRDNISSLWMSFEAGVLLKPSTSCDQQQRVRRQRAKNAHHSVSV